jgi:hypothetical protein
LLFLKFWFETSQINLFYPVKMDPKLHSFKGGTKYFTDLEHLLQKIKKYLRHLTIFVYTCSKMLSKYQFDDN